MTNSFNKELNEADQVVHLVEDQWHYPILNKFGWIPINREGRGFVRNYVYRHPDYIFSIKCTTGVSADYWSRSDTDQGGYWGSLEDALEKLHNG